MTDTPVYHALVAEHGIACPKVIAKVYDGLGKVSRAQCDQMDGHGGMHTNAEAHVQWNYVSMFDLVETTAYLFDYQGS